MQSLLSAVSRTPYKLYLLIDEYDNFANEVMISPLRGTDRYQELVEGEGIDQDLFQGGQGRARKGGASTGCSSPACRPVVLSDITSGYNVAKDLTHRAGLSRSAAASPANELRAQRWQQVAATQSSDRRSSRRTTLDLMRRLLQRLPLCAAAGRRALYNPTLALYFLELLGAATAAIPHQMLDDNLAMDRNRIQYVARLPHGEALVNAALNRRTNRSPIAQLANRFGVQDMLTAPARSRLSRLAAVLLRRADPGRAGRAGQAATDHSQSGDPQAVRRAAPGTAAAGLRRPGAAASGGANGSTPPAISARCATSSNSATSRCSTTATCAGATNWWSRPPFW
ncbi:MAG: hypothetical protein MZV65_13705 [Chromatiales bacterium]|nr:hypothetical protein [Chromatiales bacterium]